MNEVGDLLGGLGLETYPTDFTLRTVPTLLEEAGDPGAETLSTTQDVAELLEEGTA